MDCSWIELSVSASQSGHKIFSNSFENIQMNTTERVVSEVEDIHKFRFYSNNFSIIFPACGLVTSVYTLQKARILMRTMRFCLLRMRHESMSQACRNKLWKRQ